jgi:ABC-type phosphate transport system substrate-binding protein
MTRLMMPALAVAVALGALVPLQAFAASSSHAITEAQAKKEITLDGYTDVSDLHKVANGWAAKAKEGKTAVSVIADNRGNVMKQ